jgi:hypothetical protein
MSRRRLPTLGDRQAGPAQAWREQRNVPGAEDRSKSGSPFQATMRKKRKKRIKLILKELPCALSAH